MSNEIRNINNGKTGNCPTPGALTPTDAQNVAVFTGDVYDDYFEENQAELNKRFAEKGDGKDINMGSTDNSVEIIKSVTEEKDSYDFSIQQGLMNFKNTDTDMKEAIESAKMAHLYIVDNDNSKQKARMFSQYTPYSDKYSQTRIGLYAILRQEDKVLSAGHFILSYWYKDGMNGVELLYHGIAGTDSVANYLKVKSIRNSTFSQMGEIVLYADFGKLNNKSCSISFSVNARNSLQYFDFNNMNRSVSYEADYTAKPMEENVLVDANNVNYEGDMTDVTTVKDAIDRLYSEINALKLLLM